MECVCHVLNYCTAHRLWCSSTAEPARSSRNKHGLVEAEEMRNLPDISTSLLRCWQGSVMGWERAPGERERSLWERSGVSCASRGLAALSLTMAFTGCSLGCSPLANPNIWRSAS